MIILGRHIGSTILKLTTLSSNSYSVIRKNSSYQIWQRSKRFWSFLLFSNAILSSTFWILQFWVQIHIQWPKKKYYTNFHANWFIKSQTNDVASLLETFMSHQPSKGLNEINPLPTHWVTVTQADFQTPTYIIVLSVFFKSLCCYLRYFNKHHYISELLSFWLKKKLKLMEYIWRYESTKFLG